MAHQCAVGQEAARQSLDIADHRLAALHNKRHQRFARGAAYESDIEARVHAPKPTVGQNTIWQMSEQYRHCVAILLEFLYLDVAVPHLIAVVLQ